MSNIQLPMSGAQCPTPNVESNREIQWNFDIGHSLNWRTEGKMKELKDITARKDIELLVDRFYEQVRTNETLSEFFRHVNWSVHLPIMYSFWSSAILGEQSYRGNPFQKHLHLAIGKKHFDTWLTLFKRTVDENFKGENADQIKSRAEDIASVFQHKMNLMV